MTKEAEMYHTKKSQLFLKRVRNVKRNNFGRTKKNPTFTEMIHFLFLLARDKIFLKLYLIGSGTSVTKAILTLGLAKPRVRGYSPYRDALGCKLGNAAWSNDTVFGIGSKIVRAETSTIFLH